MNYHLHIQSHHHRHLLVRMEVLPQEKPLVLRLPRWRPGRYEMMDYANNVFEVRATNGAGQPVPIERTGTHEWVLAPHPGEVMVEYKYLAAVLDAGRSYVDDQQLYVNPCNLLLYAEERINEPCTLRLDIPASWKVACGMSHPGNRLEAPNFHELADSPFFASPNFIEIKYVVNGVTFHCWFLGEVRPDHDRILRDFTAFTEAQLKLFGDFPFSEYHFLFQFVEDKFHHGVEHQNNTVIVLGPGRKLNTPSMFNDFLGISSHELFHAWNVKAIRPADLQPYDYGKAQYSKLHYVTEGVTTYYGDLMLLRSGVWSLEEWLQSFNAGELGKHYANDGRNYVSLEQSSMESWTVGYNPGIPNRKISFYSKGAIVAFMLDMQIRAATANGRSLDDVMRLMYERFGKTGVGYTRSDYLGIVNEVSGKDFAAFFDRYISGTEALESGLQEAAAYVGLQLVDGLAGPPSTQLLGLVIDNDSPGDPVKMIYEESPADNARLAAGDLIFSVNGVRSNGNRIDDLLMYFIGEEGVRIGFYRNGRPMETWLPFVTSWKNPMVQLVPHPEASPFQLKNRSAWMSHHA